MNQTRLEVFNSLHPGGQSFDYQEKWADDPARYKLGVKARQIGITTTEAIDNFIECVFWKESEEHPSPPVIAFTSPSQRQSTRLMHYMSRAKARLERKYKTDFKLKKEREDWMLFQHGPEIWSLPNNPRTIEGLDLSKAIIDEVGNFERMEDEQVYDAVMASLAGKRGKLVVFGKPRGKRGLFWKLADPYGEFSQNFSVHVLPWTERARSDKAYEKTVMEHKDRMSSLAFRENYECEFADESVVMLPYDLLDRQTQKLVQWELTLDHNPQGVVFMGIDFGKKGSQTAVTLAEKIDQEIFIRTSSTNYESFDKQILWLNRYIEQFKPSRVKVDMTGLGIPLMDTLVSKFGSIVEGVHFNSNTKEKMVINCKRLLEEGKLWLPASAKDLIDQLHGIERSVTDTGKSKYSGKRTETDWLDDRAWSLMLAVLDIDDKNFDFRIVNGPRPKQYTDSERWARDLDQDGNPI